MGLDNVSQEQYSLCMAMDKIHRLLSDNAVTLAYMKIDI